MRTKKKITAVLFCFLLAAFVVCDAKESVNPTASTAPSPYPVMDSGVWADRSSNVYWIDNQHILFKGSEEKEKAKHYTGKFNISIWEPGKGVQVYAKDVVSVLCLNSDSIVYYGLLAKSPQGIEQYRYGKFGSEQTFTKPAGVKKFYWDQMNCKLTELTKVLEQRKGRAIFPLLDRHGYLDKGAIRGKESLKETPAIFYRPGHNEGITLPIRIAGLVNYYAFKDAYFITRGLGLYQDFDKPGTAWWLAPDGTVTDLVVPRNPLNKYHVEPFPTKIGIFAVSYSSKSLKDSGLAGGYFLRDGKWSKVLDGDIQGLAVSPDGCKVAFSHAPYLDADLPDDPQKRTLKLIDFCKEEKNHG